MNWQAPQMRFTIIRNERMILFISTKPTCAELEVFHAHWLKVAIFSITIVAIILYKDSKIASYFENIVWNRAQSHFIVPAMSDWTTISNTIISGLLSRSNMEVARAMCSHASATRICP